MVLSRYISSYKVSTSTCGTGFSGTAVVTAALWGVGEHRG